MKEQIKTEYLNHLHQFAFGEFFISFCLFSFLSLSSFFISFLTSLSPWLTFGKLFLEFYDFIYYSEILGSIFYFLDIFYEFYSSC